MEAATFSNCGYNYLPDCTVATSVRDQRRRRVGTLDTTEQDGSGTARGSRDARFESRPERPLSCFRFL
jgi:hypothetical protein